MAANLAFRVVTLLPRPVSRWVRKLLTRAASSWAGSSWVGAQPQVWAVKRSSSRQVSR